jgi:molecular chaperone DnaK (HSP70)
MSFAFDSPSKNLKEMLDLYGEKTILNLRLQEFREMEIYRLHSNQLMLDQLVFDCKNKMEEINSKINKTLISGNYSARISQVDIEISNLNTKKELLLFKEKRLQKLKQENTYISFIFSKSNDIKDLMISDKEKFLNKFNKEALTILNRSIKEKSTYSF